MDHSGRVRITKKFEQSPGAGFLSQIHALKLQGTIGVGRIEIHPNHRVISQQRKQPGTQVARDPRDHDDRFCTRHQSGFEAGGAL